MHTEIVFEGPLSEALEVYRSKAPEILYESEQFDRIKEGDFDLGDYAKIEEGDTDASYQKECPDHDHDCWREGCGRTVTPGYERWCHILVYSSEGWKPVKGYTIQEPGGYGF